jgi:hypothetical protein
MKTIQFSRLPVVGVLFLTTLSLVNGAPSDVSNPTARRSVVEAAAKLVESPTIPPLPAAMNNIFNPPAFGKPDAEELAAMAAARAAEAALLNKTKPATEADLLERIAEKVVPSGTLTMNDEPLLIFGQKRLRVGDHLTVTYDGKDYTLELAGIQRFTFTLRLNRAEITRRINPGKNP